MNAVVQKYNPREASAHPVPTTAVELEKKVSNNLFKFSDERFQIIVDHFSKRIEVGSAPSNANSKELFWIPILRRHERDGDPLNTCVEILKDNVLLKIRFQFR